MTIYYADFDLTTGNNDGSDASNAWQSFSDIIAGSNGSPPAAGDTVLCKGTDSMSSGVTVNIAGSAEGGFIKLIGVDGSWNNVGGSTRAVLDMQNNDYDILTYNGADYFWLENFELKNAGSSGTGYDGIVGATDYSEYCVFINCYVHNCYGRGFNTNGGYLRYASAFRCRASNNASDGFMTKYWNLFACRADANTVRGFNTNGDLLIGCIAHDNGTEGFYLYTTRAIHCVSEGNTNEGFELDYSSAYFPILLGLRSTNNGTGLAINTSYRFPVMYYYGDNNTTDASGYYDEVLNDGGNTITLDGSDTDCGYADSSSDDYNLSSSATYRRAGVSIP